MSTITINRARALELLEQAVAERGASYVDPACEFDNCLYLKGNEPGCIIGLALSKAGLPPARLKEWDDDVSGLGGITDYIRADFPGVELDEDAFTVFKAAQEVQDKGGTWGAALKAAEEQGVLV